MSYIDEIESENEYLRNHISDLKEELEEHKEELEEYKEESQKLEKELDEKSEEKKEFEDTIYELEKDMNNFESQLEELQEAIKEKVNLKDSNGDLVEPDNYINSVDSFFNDEEMEKTAKKDMKKGYEDAKEEYNIFLNKIITMMEFGKCQKIILKVLKKRMLD